MYPGHVSGEKDARKSKEHFLDIPIDFIYYQGLHCLGHTTAVLPEWGDGLGEDHFFRVRKALTKWFSPLMILAAGWLDPILVTTGLLNGLNMSSPL